MSEIKDKEKENFINVKFLYFSKLSYICQMPDARRIHKEIVECAGDKDRSGVKASPLDGLQHFEGTIHGPPDSPYANGVFSIDIRLPNDYPFEPPRMRFLTRVWHPNISSQTGAICLDILTKEWSPAFTIRTTLVSILALLTSPEPDDPQDAIVAQQYITNRSSYIIQAKDWTQKYATAKSNEELLKPFIERGIPIATARKALADAGLDLGRALSRFK